MKGRILIRPGAKVDLADHPADDRLGFADKEAAVAAATTQAPRLAELATMLAATRKRALLLVLQGIDCAGKDGAVSHVFASVSPSSLRVTPFKAPTATELGHDFLWRAHAVVPARGEIGIWNRSHYEDVLVVRVDSLVPEPVWRARYEAINAFEKHLAGEGTVIVKCFLHISQEEQAERLRERLADPRKNWKFSAADLEKRKQWPEYERAYTAMLERTSTAWAPWHVVPADRTSVRNAVISALLVDALDALKLEWPTLDPAVTAQKIT